MKPDIYEKLAATGKYFNTGKVLIGLQHYPRLHRMNRDEEIMQSILLGAYRPYISYGFTLYLVALALVVVALFIACRS